MSVVEIIGHRGAKGEAPENTVAGFRHAQSLGLAGVEFDVRMAADGVLVVIHDATVDRTTDGSGNVSTLTAAELAELDARGTCPGWPDRVGVPTLAEALDVISTFTTIQFEIKPDTQERLETITAGVLREIHERGIERRSIVTSFDPGAIEIVQRLAPGQARALIARPDDPKGVETALRLGCSQVNLHRYRETSAALVQQAHAAGLRVGGGPCDSVEDLECAVTWGMDTATSDEPSLLLAHLATI